MQKIIKCHHCGRTNKIKENKEEMTLHSCAYCKKPLDIKKIEELKIKNENNYKYKEEEAPNRKTIETIKLLFIISIVLCITYIFKTI